MRPPCSRFFLLLFFLFFFANVEVPTNYQFYQAAETVFAGGYKQRATYAILLEIDRGVFFFLFLDN